MTSRYEYCTNREIDVQSSEVEMSAKRPLTGFSVDAESLPELTSALDEVGLELWQAPEGFWAIRVKPTSPPMRSRRARRRKGEE